MKFGNKTYCGSYFIKSMTKELKSKIQNEAIKKQISKIWLEYDKEEKEEVIYIYMKEEQKKVWNVYDDVPISRTRVPNMYKDKIRNINEWLKEIAIVK